MRGTKVLFAERSEGALSTASNLLRQEGFNCTSTTEESTLFARLEQESIDILLVDAHYAPLAFSQISDPRANGANGKSGFMLELPGSCQPENSPHLRRSIVQYLSEKDSAEDIAGFVRLALPRVTVLRKARDAAKYLGSMQGELQGAKSRQRDPSSAEDLASDGAGIQALSRVVELGDAIENFSMFARSADPGCRYQHCDRFNAMGRSIRDAIEVLRATKNQFKSKELAELRKRLEATLDSCMFSGDDASFVVGERK